jgi:transposase
MSQHYAGLDVSLDQIHINVLDAAGAVVWRGMCPMCPDAVAQRLAEHAPDLVRVGLETGQLSTWLTLQLRRRKLPVICLDARHARAALKLQLNKTDAGDAYYLAQIVRTGWYREVAVKSMDAHALRMLLVARSQLVSQRQTIANTIRGLLKTFGHVVQRGASGNFYIRVMEVLAGDPRLGAIIGPMLEAWRALREQIAVMEKHILGRAKEDPVTRPLMTVPGVGPLVALAYQSVIDDPQRFTNSSTVGAYLGLTPRRWQSGEVDRQGSISRCGDAFLRGYLFESATVLLSRFGKPSRLKDWGLALAARSGLRKAKVAVARKLSVCCIGFG